MPPDLTDRSIEVVIRYEVEGRRVIALGGEAQAALKRAGVDYLAPLGGGLRPARGRLAGPRVGRGCGDRGARRRVPRVGEPGE